MSSPAPSAHDGHPGDPVALYAHWRRLHPGRGVPITTVTDCGFALGVWVRRMRTQYAIGCLPDWRYRQLVAVGFTWSGAEDRAAGVRYRSNNRWAQMVAELAEYRRDYGDVVVPSHYVCPSGNRLGEWLSRAQSAWRRGTLSQERVAELHSYGVRASREDTLEAALSAVRHERAS